MEVLISDISIKQIGYQTIPDILQPDIPGAHWHSHKTGLFSLLTKISAPAPTPTSTFLTCLQAPCGQI